MLSTFFSTYSKNPNIVEHNFARKHTKFHEINIITIPDLFSVKEDMCTVDDYKETVNE